MPPLTSILCGLVVVVHQKFAPVSAAVERGSPIEMEETRQGFEDLPEKDIEQASLLKDSGAGQEGEGPIGVAATDSHHVVMRTEFHTSTTTTVLLLAVWLAISCVVVVSNKYILYTLKFTYPATLTCWHQVCAVLMTRIPYLSGTSRSVTQRLGLTQKEYMGIIVPVAALFALSLVCNNMPYLTLSLAFIQMLKGLGPAAALLAMWSLGLQTLDIPVCISVGILVLGAVMSSVGELKFELGGFLYQILGLLFDGYRLGLTRKLLTGDKRMEPLAAMQYMAPPSALLLGLLAAVTEWPALILDEVKNIGAAIVLVNGAAAVALNLIIFELLGRTGPLTLPLCGEVKKILLVLCSIVFWGDAITLLQLVGYMVTSIGLLSSTIRRESVGGHLKARWKEVASRGKSTEEKPVPGSTIGTEAGLLNLRCP